MKCRQAKKLIFGYIDGVISESDRVGLEQHLNGCPECENTASGLARGLDLLHRLPEALPSENFNWKLRLRIARAKSAWPGGAESERAWLRAWNRRFAFGAIAAFVVVVSGGYLFIRSAGDSGGTSPGFAWRPGSLASRTVASKTDRRGSDAGEVSDPFLLPRRNGFSPQAVSLDTPVQRELRGPAESGWTPAFEADSLSQLMGTGIEGSRIRQLEAQVELLHKELLKCNVERK
jgi:hypothetical protein